MALNGQQADGQKDQDILTTIQNQIKKSSENHQLKGKIIFKFLPLFKSDTFF